MITDRHIAVGLLCCLLVLAATMFCVVASMDGRIGSLEFELRHAVAGEAQADRQTQAASDHLKDCRFDNAKLEARVLQFNELLGMAKDLRPRGVGGGP